MTSIEDFPNKSKRCYKKTRKTSEGSDQLWQHEGLRYSENSFDKENGNYNPRRRERHESVRINYQVHSDVDSDNYGDDESEFNPVNIDQLLCYFQAQRRKQLPKLTILQTKSPKKTATQLQMEKLLVDVTLRSEHKLKALAAQAQTLYEQAELLRDENKAITRIQKQQTEEMNDKTMFVRTTHNTVVDIRKAVRYTEENCLQMSDSLRKKNKKILRLRDESAKYERLLAKDRHLPSAEELERRIKKAEEKLLEKDKKIEDLNELMEEADRKAAQVYYKESKRQGELRKQICDISQECDELKKRIKNAEKRIHNTNVYSRMHQPSLGAAPKLVAITWYPANKENNSDDKVEKWLQKNLKTK